MDFNVLMNKLANEKRYAKDNYVPIIRPGSAQFLYNFIKENNIKSVLEIGTAIGFSGSIMMSAGVQSLTTIDINDGYLEIASGVFERLGFGERVKIIHGDAKDVLKNLVAEGLSFEMIFLDGAKGQYIRYLPNLIKLIGNDGVIFADNIFLGGLVESKEKIPAKKRAMVNNLRLYNQRVQENDFETKIIRLEDGIAISKYKGEL